MRRLEPIAATVPYMTAEGNHGEWDPIIYDMTVHSILYVPQKVGIISATTSIDSPCPPTPPVLIGIHGIWALHISSGQLSMETIYGLV